MKTFRRAINKAASITQAALLTYDNGNFAAIALMVYNIIFKI